MRPSHGSSAISLTVREQLSYDSQSSHDRLGEDSQRSTPPTIVALPKQLRVLWRVERKEFRVQVIQAAIYAHPNGQELRVFMEPEEKNDLLWSSVQRFDFTPLEAKAAELREVLLEKGWTHLA